MTLVEGKGNQPQPSHTWNGLLIANILQEVCPRDCITKAVVLALGEAIPFFVSCSCIEGLLYRNAQDIELSLRGPITWTGRTAWAEATVHIMPEGHRAMTDAIMEKKTKTKVLGHPQGLRKATQPSAGTCYTDDWRGDLDEEASNDEVRRIDHIYSHGHEPSDTYAQCISGGGS